MLEYGYAKYTTALFVILYNALFPLVKKLIFFFVHLGLNYLVVVFMEGFFFFFFEISDSICFK